MVMHDFRVIKNILVIVHFKNDSKQKLKIKTEKKQGESEFGPEFFFSSFTH